MSLELTSDDLEMLNGRDGEAVSMAMRIIVRLAETVKAENLIDITGAHIDSCLYHGLSTIDFADRLVQLGAKVKVPTTLNVSSMASVSLGTLKLMPLSEKVFKSASLLAPCLLRDSKSLPKAGSGVLSLDFPPPLKSWSLKTWPLWPG